MTDLKKSTLLLLCRKGFKVDSRSIRIARYFINYTIFLKEFLGMAYKAKHLRSVIKIELAKCSHIIGVKSEKPNYRFIKK